MSGTFDYTDSTLSFSERIITTKMNCVGYNERAFIDNLLRTTHYRLQNGMLILLFNQTELSHWTRKVVPKPVSNKTWWDDETIQAFLSPIGFIWSIKKELRNSQVEPMENPANTSVK